MNGKQNRHFARSDLYFVNRIANCRTHLRAASVSERPPQSMFCNTCARIIGFWTQEVRNMASFIRILAARRERDAADGDRIHSRARPAAMVEMLSIVPTWPKHPRLICTWKVNHDGRPLAVWRTRP